MAPYDILGNVVLVKFDRSAKSSEKKRFATRFLKDHREITTVLEKSARIKGRLRTPTTKWIAGEKTKEALYTENGCSFRLNVDSCYFSPRLASERSELASLVKKGDRVLVMFGGVGPFAVVMGKKNKASEIISVELGREPHRYAVENVKRNKLANVMCVQGNVRRVVPTLKGTFDRIVMARPNLEDSFLDVAFKVINRGGTIHYYGFYPEEGAEEALRTLILSESQKAKKKVRIMRIKKAGDIGTRRYRYRVDIKAL